MADSSHRATHEQWLDLLSEVAHLVSLLEGNGERALARIADANAPAWDAYPTSSLPESSITSGRMHRPVENTVVRHAGGLDYEDPRDLAKIESLESKGINPTTDAWADRFDPIGVAVNRMQAEVFDACNRLATAQEASFAARALCVGQVFGKPQDGEKWGSLIVHLETGLSQLIQISGELRPLFATDEQKAARRRMTYQVEDARNRLRGAVAAMNDALPVPIPDVAREKCPGCGFAKDVVTWWGQKPRQWINGEGKCRECTERPRRVAKGIKAS